MVLLLGLSVSAQTTYTKADSLTVCRLLKEAPANASTLWFARQFHGVPYVAHTLEVNDREQLVVNTRQLDCTTLVETVTALTLCVKQEKRQWTDYLQALRILRYRQGVLNGYPSRLHYFTDWILDKQQMGLVEEIQRPNPESASGILQGTEGEPFAGERNSPAGKGAHRQDIPLYPQTCCQEYPADAADGEGR